MPSPVRLISVGRIKEPYLAAGIGEYLKRLRPFCKLEVVELKDEGMEKEAKRIEKYANENTFALDAGGKSFDSLEFAELIKSHELSPQPLTFVIGGPQGLDPALKKKAKLISLSKMTFTHEMCRLFFLEQLYRAFMINSNRSYHK